MNKDLYILSNAVQAFVGFSNNLKKSAIYGYKVAADQQNPESETLMSKLEAVHEKELDDMLLMAKEGQKYIGLLVRELELQQGLKNERR